MLLSLKEVWPILRQHVRNLKISLLHEWLAHDACWCSRMVGKCNKLYCSNLQCVQKSPYRIFIIFLKKLHTAVAILHTVSIKFATWYSLITLANVDGFLKFFHQLIHKKILCVHHKQFHLTYNMLLHYLTDFDSILNKLLTHSWGHFEHLI